MRHIDDLLIKVLSLGIGLAIGLALLAKVCFELSYDGSWPDRDRIYRIRTTYRSQGEDVHDFGQVSGGVAPGFREEVPGVEEATRFTGMFMSDKFFDEGRNALTVRLEGVDSCFFRIFPRTFLAGDPEAALKAWTGDIAVSRTVAERLGGIHEAIGQVIWNEGMPDLKLNIVGVYEDFPENGSLHFDALACLNGMGQSSIHNWIGNDRYSGYVKLAPGVDPASLTDAIHAMQVAHQPLDELLKNGRELWYTLERFDGAHRRDPQVRNTVSILLIVALLLILVSVMNYVLIAINDVLKRAKEVGVRKCYGAESRDIHGLLLRETAVNLAWALAVAALLIYAFRGVIGDLAGVELRHLVVPQTIGMTAGLVMVVFLASAVIPARMFLKIPVSSAFRSYRENKRRWKLSLLTFQFLINAFLIVTVLIVGAQYRLVVHDDPGYSYDRLVTATLPGERKATISAIVEAVRALPEVEGAELTYTLPIDKSSGNNVYLPDDGRELFNVADQYGATEGFFDLLGFRLLEGAAPQGPKDVAVSRSFVERMGLYADWSDGAVGKGILLTEHSEAQDDIYTVCGVYEDYRIGSLLDLDGRPSVRFCWSQDADHGRFDWSTIMYTVAVKLRAVTPETVARVHDAIAELVPEREVEVVSYREAFLHQYNATRQLRQTFAIGTGAALLIALIGLIGYIRDESRRRSAEIAVRKVNGAYSSEIVGMFVAGILRLALVAVALGDLGAAIAARRYLQNFAERVTLGPGRFLAGDILLIAIIAAVVVLCSLRIARTDPAVSLKND